MVLRLRHKVMLRVLLLTPEAFYDRDLPLFCRGSSAKELHASPENWLRQKTTSSRWRIPRLKYTKMSFLETRLAFRRFSVKEPRHLETVLISGNMTLLSIVERVARAIPMHSRFFSRLACPILASFYRLLKISSWCVFSSRLRYRSTCTWFFIFGFRHQNLPSVSVCVYLHFLSSFSNVFPPIFFAVFLFRQGGGCTR